MTTRAAAMAPNMGRPAGLAPDALVVLVGAAGCGKSSWAARRFASHEILSSDAFREMVSGDAADQAASGDAFRLLHLAARARLRRGLRTVIDATNLSARGRRSLMALARSAGRPAVAVVFEVPLAVCLTRNAARTGRQVAANVIFEQHRQLTLARTALPAEGFASIIVVDESGTKVAPAARSDSPNDVWR